MQLVYNQNEGVLVAYQHPGAECPELEQFNSCGFAGAQWIRECQFLESNHVLMKGVVPLVYKSVWDANDNIPDLVNRNAAEGDAYRVAVPGSTSLGNINSWAVNDLAIFESSRWNQVTPVPVDLTAATCVGKFRSGTVTGEVIKQLAVGDGIVVNLDPTTGKFNVVIAAADMTKAVELAQQGNGDAVLDLLWTLNTGEEKPFPPLFVITAHRLAAS